MQFFGKTIIFTIFAFNPPSHIFFYPRSKHNKAILIPFTLIRTGDNLYPYAIVFAMRKNANDRILIDDEKMEVSSEILRALAHPLRMRILAFIDRHGSINVNKIYNTLQLEQSITSQHLRILRVTGIVETEREGKYVMYKIAYDKLGESIAAIRRFIEDFEDFEGLSDL